MKNFKKLTVFTSSIFPDVTRVWYYFIKNNIEPHKSNIVIYDCGAKLKKNYFETAEIFRFPNIEHGKKIDHFIKNRCTTPFLFICDDDAFVLDKKVINDAIRKMELNPKCAAYSFKFRDWWQFDINNKFYYPMGSYAVIVNVDIIRKENLSFSVKRTGNPAIRKGSGYYDTADYACEQLIKRGYDVIIAPNEEQNVILTLFGTSSGFRSLVKKKLFSSQYKLRKSKIRLINNILKNSYNFQRTCTVSIIEHLYSEFFLEKSAINYFWKLSELKELVKDLPSEKQYEYLKKYKFVNTAYMKLKDYLS